MIRFFVIFVNFLLLDPDPGERSEAMRIRNRNTGCGIVSDPRSWIRILKFISMPDPVSDSGFAITLAVKI
jgi:hypothetical protein